MFGKNSKTKGVCINLNWKHVNRMLSRNRHWVQITKKTVCYICFTLITCVVIIIWFWFRKSCNYKVCNWILQTPSRLKSIIDTNTFTFVRWALYKINCGSFCMNRMTFRDPSVGGVLVKTWIIALRRSTFLKEKQIHHVIKFSFVFGLTNSLSQLLARFMDLPSHQSRSYRMNANRSSFNS